MDEGILLADRIIPLRPGPNATLGPEFIIDLERPRDKKELNRDPRFINLRNSIAKYLLKVGSERESVSGSSEKFILPEVKPKKFTGTYFERTWANTN